MSAYGMNYFFGENVKPCKKCGELKSTDAFPKVPKARDGRGGSCYACCYASKAKLLDDDRRAKNATRQRKWKSLNQDKVKARRSVDKERDRQLRGRVTIEEWRARLHERRAERDTARAVAKMDAAVLLDIRRAMNVGTWREHGISEAEQYRRRYVQNPRFRASELIRSRIKKALRERPGTQSPTVEKVLGYTMDEFRSWFESRFREGMSWDAFFDGDIHIDHIRPLSMFDLTNDDEMRRAWALSNIQPLWAWENREKGARDDTELVSNQPYRSSEVRSLGDAI